MHLVDNSSLQFLLFSNFLANFNEKEIVHNIAFGAIERCAQ